MRRRSSASRWTTRIEPSPLWGEGRVRGMKNRTDRARTLRREPTLERKMWSKLRDRRFLGFKFKRQVP
ncbi:MAG: DUF559 domain-containing protein, partial [Methyloceanibacter sp.]